MYEDGDSTSASDTEISGLVVDQLQYQDTASANDIPADVNLHASNKVFENPSLKGEQISRIAQALSSASISPENKQPEEQAMAIPRKSDQIIVHNVTHTSEEIQESRPSVGSLAESDANNSELGIGIACEQSEDDDLEWEEEYHIDKGFPLKDKPKERSARDVGLHIQKLSIKNRPAVLNPNNAGQETQNIGIDRNTDIKSVNVHSAVGENGEEKVPSAKLLTVERNTETSIDGESLPSVSLCLCFFVPTICLPSSNDLAGK